MSSAKPVYVDEYQNVHHREDDLGDGGQGVVFRTGDPDLAIKLVTGEGKKPVTDAARITYYSSRFKRVRLLPLPEDLNISVPVALLANHAGYVMRLLSEMVPFSHFLLDSAAAERISGDAIPSWLSAMETTDAKKIVHYYQTGGLRRRLFGLYKCASLLARLHGRGLVYGDISPNNIFISRDLADTAVWLIDADNVRFEQTTGGSVVFTPKYGAPELVKGEDEGRPASDCHAFAVVAFYLLALIHPFMGKKVDGSEDQDWAEEEGDGDPDEKAYAGEYPWVDDRDDDANASDKGLPRSLLLTPHLQALFDATLGAGRTTPSLRPAIYHWPEALAQAADLTVNCPGCGMQYYYDYLDIETETHRCPYCAMPRPSLLVLESYRWTGDEQSLGEPCWRFIREIPEHGTLTLPRRLFGDFTQQDSDSEELLITLSDHAALFRKSEQSKAELSLASGMFSQRGFTRIEAQLQIAPLHENASFWLFAQLNSPRLVRGIVSGGEQ
ncbi:serine/threonine protein kinase [Yersinia enterocolitica]